MFAIIPTKVFKDSVHGYINVPKCFVDHIIDTEMFQRLRNIDQTGMRILYPDAKHDRFGHSLGVFHLGSKAVDALLANFSDNVYWRISSDITRTLFWSKNKVLFLIACLLHDIGHTPFSHSLENLVYTYSSTDGKVFGQLFKEKLMKMEALPEEDFAEEEPIKGAQHEILGAMMVLEKFGDNVSAIYKDLQDAGYPQDGSVSFLYAEHYVKNSFIDDAELNQDLCFIARMITGLKYKSFAPEKQIRNCFIELLNGENFDVDKLDYIMRDTQMSGISNINIDIERLINAVSIVVKTKYSNYIFKDMNYAPLTVHSMQNHVPVQKRFSGKKIKWNNFFHIKGIFKGTFIFEQNTYLRICAGSEIAALSGEKQGAKIVFWNNRVVVSFQKSSEIWRDKVKITALQGDVLSLPMESNNQSFEVELKNARIAAGSEFCFQTRSKGRLEINGKCDFYISGIWNTESSVTFLNHTQLSGPINEITFMGDTIADDIPSASAYTVFSVGFRKQALNIIANVLEARNYLYLWVYAHHKVVYYANYLLPVLADELILTPETRWYLQYKDLLYLDDAYIWTIIKYNYQKFKESSKRSSNDSHSDIEQLCYEVLTHNYKTSVWKSLAEFQLLFESFSDTEIKNIRRHFLDNIDWMRPCVLDRDGDFTGGYLNESLLTRINEEAGLENCIKSIVCVSAIYKFNKINPNENYVIMQEGAIPLDKIALFSRGSETTQTDPMSYFYLYYNLNADDEGSKIELTREEITGRIWDAVKKLADSMSGHDRKH